MLYYFSHLIFDEFQKDRVDRLSRELKQIAHGTKPRIACSGCMIILTSAFSINHWFEMLLNAAMQRPERPSL